MTLVAFLLGTITIWGHQDPEALHRAGIASIEQGRYREAESALRQALVILCVLGQVMNVRGKTAAAANFLERALSIVESTRSPELSAVLYMLGQTRYLQRKLDEAEQMYRRAIAMESSEHPLMANLMSG